jgi:IS605 OrfB family transposase
MSTHNTECVVVKIMPPTKRKELWLNSMAKQFSQAVQLGLAVAQAEQTSSRAKLHQVVYHAARQQFGLPAEYARMAVNATVGLARSYYGLRKCAQRCSFPKVNNRQGIGLGMHAYAVVQDDDRFVLRVSTGTRGQHIWLPLCVPARYRDSLTALHGDARLFRRRGQWYVMLPVRYPCTPTGSSGEHTFIGVDLGIVRHATIATPDRTVFFSGQEARHRREHYADLRRRYQAHRRSDRVKDQKGKERRWMGDLNHKLSRQIVDLAAVYPDPVLVLERLVGIRDHTRGSKRFNRMMASWSFRDLVDKIKYKAARLAIPVVFVDPRKTSQTCSKCGHATAANRLDQATFRCVKCGYRTNADRNAACNIAALGPMALAQEPPDTTRPDGQTGEDDPRPDGVHELAQVRSDPNLASFTLESQTLQVWEDVRHEEHTYEHLVRHFD